MRFFLFFLIPLFLFSDTIVVDNDPASSFFGGKTDCTGENDFENNISDAINKANDGDTILVCGGDKKYEENLDIEKNLIIKYCTSDDDSDCDGSIVKLKGDAYVKADSLSILGFSIENKDHDAIYIDDLNRFKLTDVSISSSKAGISIKNADTIIFNNVSISTDSDPALYIKDNKNATLNNIEFDSDDSTIYIVDSKEFNITSSKIKGGSDAVYFSNFEKSYMSNIEFNSTEDDNDNIYIKKGGSLFLDNIKFDTDNKGASVYIQEIENISVKNSIFNNIKYEDIYIKNLNNEINLTNNDFISGERGLAIKENAPNGYITYNRFHNLSYRAIDLFKDEVDSNLNIYYNCFKNNKKNAYINSSGVKLDDGSLGNYWDDLEGNSYKVDPIPIYDNHPISACMFFKPLSEYRFSECSVDDDNDTYEIKDNGSKNISLTTLNNADLTDGQICRGINIVSDDDNDKALLGEENIELPDNYLLTAWIKFPLDESGHKEFEISSGGFFGSTKHYKYYNIADRPGKDEYYIYFSHNTDDDVWQLCVDTTCKDFNPQDLSGWHMVAFQVSSDDENTTFYFDGENNLTFDKYPTGSIGLIFNSDDDPNDDNDDNNPNGESIGAIVDEFKIFNKIFDDDTIKLIYQNENNHKNFNGACRICKVCNITPIEFEGGVVTLKDTYDDPTWTHIDFKKEFSTVPVIFMVIDKRGGNPAAVRLKNISKTGFDATLVEPEGEDGPHVEQNLSYFAINKGVHLLDGHYIEVGTISTNKVQGKNLDSSENNISWEKIKPVATFCNPAVVANIQSLNNEKGDIPKKPSKPWMTAAIENNSSGIFLALDASETTDGYPLDKNETIGYMISDAPFKGVFKDSSGNDIKFEIQKTDRYFVGWDDECKKINFLNSYKIAPLIVASKDSRYGNNGGWFRRCYLDKNELGLVVDEDRAEDDERSHIKEVGAIFAFSDVFIVDENDTNNSFDAWDVDKNIDNPVITTKIVGKDFNITIASLDENGTSLKEFNGTVCVRVINNNGDKLTNWIKVDDFLNSVKESNITNININKAVKDARIQIQYKKDVDEDCPLDSNETNSSDNFAIRPEKFDISNIPNKIISADDFNITLKALNFSDDDTLDYNETLNDSYKVEFTQIKNCNKGELDVKNGAFKDGETNLTLNYNDIGELNITIRELNSSEFAYVDRDDTNDTIRLISPVTKIIYISPYKFEVNASVLNKKDFIYFNNDFNKSLNLEINISALNKNNQVTSNYNEKCYAKNIEINISKEITFNNENIAVNNILYRFKDINNNYSTIYSISKDKNISILYKDSNFTTDHNGSTTILIEINFDRNESNASNPLKLTIDNINVTDNNISGEKNNISDKNFYYGNLILDDIYTTNNDFNKEFYFVLYDENSSDTLKPDSKEIKLNWYKNIYHSIDDGNLSDSDIIVSSDYNASNHIDDVTVNLDSIKDGIIKLHIKRDDNSIKFVVVHLLSKNLKWLWYSKYQNSYDISDNSSCLNHFCFTISWKNNSSDSDDINASAGSGEFHGRRANIEEDNSTRNIGLKIYR